MIQDIYPHIFSNAYQPRPARDNDIVFFFDEKGAALDEDGHPFLYRNMQKQDCIYLFEIDSTAYYLTDQKPEKATVLSIRGIRTYEPAYLRFALITAWQLYTWTKDNRFCGRCGSPLKPDQKERALRCEKCGNIIYPKISPAVIVGILNPENKILLTRFAGRSFSHEALVSGFAEIGETIEETVIREVKEETGLTVSHLRYYKSQPWSFSSTLLVGFFCRAENKQTIRLDQNELSSARWAKTDEFIDNTGDISLTSEMIRYFQEGKISYDEL